MMETGKNAVVPKDWDGGKEDCVKSKGFFCCCCFVFVCLLFVFRTVKLFCIIL